jgi:hypothetical protein
MTSGKVITCCGDCIHYNFEKHKCNVGHSAEIDAKEKFYADCTTFENVEEYERKAYNKAVDDTIKFFKEKFAFTILEEEQIDEIAERLKGEKQNEDFKQKEM